MRLSLAALLALLLACERLPDASREWTPADHDRSDEKSKVATGAQAAPRSSGSAAGDDTAEIVEVAWRQQCASCHGPTGKGDGPTGPMVGAKDLTSVEVQAKLTDAEIAATIRNGKGKMPKFALPDRIVDGLVARVRALRGR